MSLTKRFCGKHDERLEATLSAAINEARALGVQAPEQHLDAWTAALTGEAPEVRWAELLLVAAVVAGDERALQRFDAEFLTVAAAGVARRYPPLHAEDLAQATRERLLVGEGVARLRAWGGRGALLAWLRAVATRLALDLVPREKQRALDDAAWERAVTTLTSGATPELALIEQTRRVELTGALREALRRLPRREKVVLRLHVFQSLSTDQLGRVFHVAPSTVRRWIQGARSTVLETMHALLTEQSKWSRSQIDSALARLSTRELSLSGLADSATGTRSHT